MNKISKKSILLTIGMAFSCIGGLAALANRGFNQNQQQIVNSQSIGRKSIKRSVDDTHAIAAFTGKDAAVLLNNGNAPETINLADQGYEVKQVIIGWQHNKSNNGVTATVTVGGNTLGTGKVGGQSTTTTTTIGDGMLSLSGAIEISFENGMTGTGKGTLYLRSLTLVEGGTPEPEKTLTSISYEGTLTKFTYVDNESFDPAGLTFTAHYDDSSSEELDAAEIEWPALVAGNTSITGTYGGQSVTINGLTITAAPTLTSLELVTAPTKTEYEEGDTFDPAGMTVNGVYSDSSTSPIDINEITWANAGVLTLNQTSIIGTYQELNVEVTGLTVSEKQVAPGYTLITSNEDLVDGAKYLVVCETSNAAYNGNVETLGSNNSLSVTIDNHHIEGSDGLDNAAFTLNEMDGGYSLLSHTGLYIGGTSGSNTVATSESQLLNTISIDTDEADIASNTSHLRFNTASSIFRYYKSASYTNQTSVQLYKADDAVTKTIVSVAEAEGSELAKTSYYDGDSLDPTGLKLTVTYDDASTEEILGSAVTWNTLHEGDTSITGTYKGFEFTLNDKITVLEARVLQSLEVTHAPTKVEYLAGETFDPAGLEVTGHYNVGDDALININEITWANSGVLEYQQESIIGTYQELNVEVTGLTVNDDKIHATVAEALEVCAVLNNEDVTEDTYVIEGFVKAITTAYSSTYHNISFTMTDVAGEGSDLLAFRVATDAETAAKLVAGVQVRVTAKLTKYNSTLETNAGGTLVILNETPIAPTTHNVTVAEALTVAASLADNETTYSLYHIEGYITEVNNAYANGIASFTIADTIDGAETIYCFKINMTEEQGGQLAIGVKVGVTANLQKYVKDAVTTPELKNSTAFEVLALAPVSGLTAAEREHIQGFIDANMQMSNDAYSGEVGPEDGACRNAAQFADVVSAFNGLTERERNGMMTDAQYTEAAARLSAWARANEYEFTNDYLLEDAGDHSAIMFSNDFSSLFIILMSAVGVMAIGFTSYMILKRKKAHK